MPLNKKNRLKSKKDFNSVFRSGKTVNGSFLFIKFKINNLNNSRFGFVTGLKVSPKAVVRNKIKRLLSEAARIRLRQVKNNYDIIAVVKSVEAIKMIQNDRLSGDFIAVLKKAGII